MRASDAYYQVSLDYYRRESVKILNLHRECMPAGVEVEKASIDEGNVGIIHDRIEL